MPKKRKKTDFCKKTHVKTTSISQRISTRTVIPPPAKKHRVAAVENPPLSHVYLKSVNFFSIPVVGNPGHLPPDQVNF
jgi:hypothetical protein